MRLSKTTIHLDTCDCHIEWEFDADLPQDQRVNSLASIVKCSIHQVLSDQEAAEAAYKENNGRQNLLGLIKKTFPALTKTVIQEDGSEAVEFLPDKEPTVTYSKDLVNGVRTMEVDVPITLAEKSLLETKIVTDIESVNFGNADIAVK